MQYIALEHLLPLVGSGALLRRSPALVAQLLAAVTGEGTGAVDSADAGTAAAVNSSAALESKGGDVAAPAASLLVRLLADRLRDLRLRSPVSQERGEGKADEEQLLEHA